MGRQAEASYEEKVRAVKNYLDGESAPSIAKHLGRHRVTVYKWLSLYKKRKKFEDLKDKERSGRPAKIDKAVLQKLERDLCKPASQFGFETDLWTCSRVHSLLKKKYEITLSRGHVWVLLIGAGFSYQKPERRYYESDPVAQERWIQYDLPKIKKVAKKHRAILYFEDEASLSLTPVVGKTWAPKGQTPLLYSTSRRGSLAALSAISKSGHLVFKLKRGRVTSKDVIDFLGQMLKSHPRRHLVVIMDRSPTHRSKKTQDFIKTQKKLHVFYLPPRSPEFNPDEKVWNHLKNQELKGHRETSLKGLHRLSSKKLRALASDKKKVQSIFNMSSVAKLL